MCYSIRMSNHSPSYVFSSRYGQIRSVTQIDETQYLVEGSTRYVRFGHDPNDNSTMADFEGGPYIATGEYLHNCVGRFPCVNASTVVKSVKFIKPEQAAKFLGFTDTAIVSTFDKPDYSYCLVETE